MPCDCPRQGYVGSRGDLNALTLSQLQAFCPLIEDDVFSVLHIEGSLAARNHTGGTAPGQVCAAIERARQRIKSGI
jgi:argininosuccinate lyase